MISNILRNNSRGRYKILSLTICLFLVVMSIRVAHLSDAFDIDGFHYYSGLGSSTGRNSTSSSSGRIDPRKLPAAATPGKYRRANSTLGFEKILYINLPWRHDKDDAMVLEAAVSGIDIIEFPGVPVDDMLEKGLGPNSNKGMTQTEKACYRSHMNAWREIIQNNWESVLIMESDAAWDTNVRDIMGYFTVGMENITHQQGVARKGAKYRPEDPYMTRYWDVLQLSTCGNNGLAIDANVKYYDPYVVPGVVHEGIELGEDERLIRYGFFGVCTSAYAVTRRGAMKLLQRATVNMADSVDIVIGAMAEEGNFHSFATIPDIFAQAGYRDGLGMNHRNSDREVYDETGDYSQEAWDVAWSKMSPFVVKDMYGWVQFRNFALWDLKSYLYGPEPAAEKEEEEKEEHNTDDPNTDDVN